MSRLLRMRVTRALAAGVLAASPTCLAQVAPSDPPPPGESNSAPQSSSPGPDSRVAPPEQVLWLVSGAVVRGQVIEVQPGQHVTLQLATGEIRTIEWPLIDRASWVETPPSRARTASNSPAPSDPRKPAPSSAPGSPDRTDGVRVQLRSEVPGLVLESRERPSLTDLWQLECHAPCHRRLRVQHKEWRVRGPSVHPSNPFVIGGKSGEETLVVAPGSDALRTWGQRSLVGGIVLAVLASAAYGAGRVEGEKAPEVVGLTGMLVGAALIAVGIPLTSAGKTTVRNGRGERVAHGSTVGAEPL